MKKTLSFVIPIALIVVLVFGIFIIRKLSAQNFSYVSQLNVSGEWDFYLKIPPQPNISISYYHGKSAPSSTLIRFEQMGNVLWIPNVGENGMGYIDNQKIHFSYLITQGKFFILYTFDGTISEDSKSMSGHFTIKVYKFTISGDWTATKESKNCTFIIQPILMANAIFVS